MPQGELSVQGSIVYYQDVDSKGKPIRTMLEDVDAYGRRFGVMAANVARFLKKQCQPPILSKEELDAIQWPLSTTGFAVKDAQRDCLNDIISKKMGKALVLLGMSLGKTVIAALMAWYYGGAAVSITPKNKVMDFQRHLSQWTGTKFTCVKALLNAKSAVEFLTETPPHERHSTAVCMSFETASNVKVFTALSNWFFRVVLVDEAHLIKNPKSIRAQVIFNLAKKASCCLLLTATPTPNRASELFAPLKTLHPTYFSNYFQFSERYCNGKLVHGKWIESGIHRLNEFRCVIDACIATLPEEVQQAVIDSFPPRTDSVITLPTPPDEFIVEYNSMKKQHAKLQAQQQKLDPNNPAVKNEFARLKNKCNVISGKMRKLTGLVKARFVAEYVANEALPNTQDSYNLAIFCHHNDVAMLTKKHLDELGVHSLVLTGRTPEKKRSEIIDKYRSRANNPNERVLILSLKASAFGIELTPGFVKVVCGEFGYTDAEMKQADARIHRLSATQPVECIRLILTPSYDDTMLSMLGNKASTDTRLYKRQRLE